jgi:hypothetical protein
MPQHPPDNGEAILPLSAEDVSIEHRHIEQGENSFTSESVKQAAAGAADTLNTAKEQARDYAERGMEYASDYSGQLAEFVQREPWMNDVQFYHG